jgi:hypothetical protein
MKTIQDLFVDPEELSFPYIESLCVPIGEVYPGAFIRLKGGDGIAFCTAGKNKNEVKVSGLAGVAYRKPDECFAVWTPPEAPAMPFPFRLDTREDAEALQRMDKGKLYPDSLAGWFRLAGWRDTPRNRVLIARVHFRMGLLLSEVSPCPGVSFPA